MVFVVSIEFYVFVVAILAIVTLAILLSLLAVSLWISLSALSVTFSRLAMSLLISAGVLFTDFDLNLFQNGFLNFLARLALIYGILWLASFVPRLEPAIGTFCTFFVALVVVLLTMGFGCTLYDAFAKPAVHSTTTWWFYAACGLAVTLAVVFNWLRDMKRAKSKSAPAAFLSKPVFVHIGRVLASPVYGFILFMILGVSLNRAFPQEVWIQALLLGGFSVAAYLADLFFYKRLEA